MSDSDNTPFGFGRFVPGFDFLQNLAKGASSGVSAMPGLTSWVAPTVSVEELEKRIGELKSVQFWLEQNTRALAATVQALEVQKMTLATLENMNVAMGDMAGAFGTKMADVTGGAQKFAETFATPKAKAEPAAPAHESAQPQAAAAAAAADKKQKSAAEGGGAGGAAAFMPGASGLADPVQWWTSLTNQFQQIAASAMRDVSQHAANAPAGAAAGSGAANDALKAASDMASQFAAQSMKGAQEMTRTAMEAATQVTKVAKATAAPAAKKAAAKAAAPAKKTAAAAAKKPAASKPRSSK